VPFSSIVTIPPPQPFRDEPDDTLVADDQGADLLENRGWDGLSDRVTEIW
jgi:hypothetical protein